MFAALLPAIALLLFTSSPSFEVASVKLAPERSGEARFVRMTEDEARVAYTNITLRILITMAYQVSDERLIGADGWIDSTPYDVAASIPAGVSKSEIPAMLRSLLQERFQLAVHKTTKLMTAYDLVVAKSGSKLKPVTDATRGPNYILRGRVEGGDMSMGALAGILAKQVGRPVVDMTHLAGFFDVRLKWRPDDTNPNAGGGTADPSIYTAVQEQLGLQLVSAKEPIDFLAVDNANRIPAEN